MREGGNSCGYVSFTNERFWAGGHCYVIDNISNMLATKFLFYVLKSSERGIMRLRVGSGMPNIQKKRLYKCISASVLKREVAYPDLKDEEQVFMGLLGYGMFADKLPLCFTSENLLGYALRHPYSEGKPSNHAYMEYRASRNIDVSFCHVQYVNGKSYIFDMNYPGAGSCAVAAAGGARAEESAGHGRRLAE
ncbi:MAG: restriction endonuclease subunit S [Kiritimatiellia bacterium]